MSPGVIEKIVPVLPTNDGEEMKAYYVGKLGFELDFEWRHAPGFPAQIGVKYGDHSMHLSEHARGQQGAELYIFVDNIVAWAERCRARGVDIGDGPDTKPWGNTEMTLTDPSGNLLRITEIGTHEPTAKSA